MKTYKVAWTNEAILDLQEIMEFVALDRLSSAKSIYKNIKSKCFGLKKYPERFRVVPELQEVGITNYREIVEKPYRIIYKLDRNLVYVIAVVDCRRDFEAFIFNRLIR